MVEVIRHSLGLCGDAHPNLITLILSVGGIGFYLLKHNIKWCWNSGCDYCVKTYKSIKDGE